MERETPPCCYLGSYLLYRYLGSNKIEGSTKVQCLPIVLITFRPYIHSYLSHLISLLEVSEVNSKGNIVLMVDKPL